MILSLGLHLDDLAGPRGRRGEIEICSWSLCIGSLAGKP
jgi:hypothetical protein